MSPTADHATKQRVLVIENHAMFRQNLVNWIAEQDGLECCGEAESVSQGQTAVREQRPDLVLLDLFLDGPDGFDFLNWVKSGLSKIPVIILSQHPEQQYALASLDAGARGYVSKAVATEELPLAIDAVLDGSCYVSGRGAFHRGR
jgi:two-component system invasion response regulator UvrY